MSILLFFLILIVLVVVHELGHFLIAKWSGIEVKEFGFGFPPRIFGRMWRGTLYSINWIPFGGFVKIFGEDPEELPTTEEEKAKHFSFKPRPIQAAVLVAGVTFNMLFAWLLISLGFITGLPSSVGAPTSGQVQDAKVVITEVVKDSPAEKAGLKVGDAILSLQASNQKIDHFTVQGVQEFIGSHGDQTVQVQYKRGEQSGTLSVIPKQGIVQGKSAIGIAMDMIGIVKLPFLSALAEGASLAGYIFKNVALGLATFIWNAVTFRAHFSDVTGPVGIVGLVGSARQLGFAYILSLAAFISINLAVINLLPFPALDGARLVFVAIEAIIRRPINPRVANMINTIGFFVLIALMLVVTLHDIVKLF